MHIAYQVVGDVPIDLVYAPDIWSNLEIMWEWPAWERYLIRLGSFSRLILFDETLGEAGQFPHEQRLSAMTRRRLAILAVLAAAQVMGVIDFSLSVFGAVAALGVERRIKFQPTLLDSWSEGAQSPAAITWWQF